MSEPRPQQLLMSRLLHTAVLHEDVVTAAELVQTGAKGDLVLREGSSPLHLAVGLENQDVSDQLTRLLLEAGCDPNVRGSDGVTPVHVAASYGRCTNLELLLLNGGDPFLEDSEGVDAFGCAQSIQCAVCIMLLEQWRLDMPATPSDHPAKFHYSFKTYLVNGDYDQNGDSPSSTNSSSQEEESCVDVTPYARPSCPYRPTCSDLHPRAFQSYSHRLHQIDVTSPDHPMLVRRTRADDTVVTPVCDHSRRTASRDHTFMQQNTTNGSGESSKSFHTCSDGSHCSQEYPRDDPYSPEYMYMLQCRDPVVEKTQEEDYLEQSVCNTNNNNTMCSGEETVDSDISNTISEETSIAGFYFSQRDLRVHSPVVEDVHSRPCAEADSQLYRVDDVSQCFDNVTMDDTLPVEELSLMTLDESTLQNSPRRRYATRTMAKSDLSALDSGMASLDSQSLSRLPKYHKFPFMRNPSLNSTCSILSSGSKGSQCSCRSTSSTVTLVYTDVEDGYSLIETQLPPLQHCDWNHTRDEGTFSDSTILYDWRDSGASSESDVSCLNDVIPARIQELSNSALRQELVSLGDQPGPVLHTTRQIYEKRLVTLQNNPGLAQGAGDAKKPEFLAELRGALKDELDASMTQQLDTSMAAPFLDPDPTRHWREGCTKCSFNYLLLDPRVTCNLPNRVKTIGETEGFRCFLKSVFYIGKGKRSRPYCHFKEAIRQMQNPQLQPSSKVTQILDIWGAGSGVISLHVFQNVIPVEAYTREACMILALGLDRLTNQKAGDFYGPASTWLAKKKRQLGAAMLKKAFKILLLEGERQIRPHDVKVGQ